MCDHTAVCSNTPFGGCIHRVCVGVWLADSQWVDRPPGNAPKDLSRPSETVLEHVSSVFVSLHAL